MGMSFLSMRFPGWKRPGLIEARCWLYSSVPTWLFPGWKRPGLIEASLRRAYVHRSSSFPGWKRPGLIEAQLVEFPLVGIGLISGVETPRPH